MKIYGFIAILALFLVGNRTLQAKEPENRPVTAHGSFLKVFCTSEAGKDQQICKAIAEGLKIVKIDAHYRVKGNARLREAPNTKNARVVGSIVKGREFEPYGRILDDAGEPWLVLLHGDDVAFLKQELAEEILPAN